MPADLANATEPDPRSELLGSYLEHLSHQRHLAAGTRRNYLKDIEALFELNPGLALGRMQPQHIRRSVAQLHARGLSGRTIAHMLSAWRGLFTWLARHRGYSANPCLGLRAPKAPRGLPKALSPEAAGQLLDAPAETPPDIRDKAMFELAYSSGLRLAELVSLDLAHADAIRRDAEVTVTGKGGKTRSVPVGAKARAAIEAWLLLRALLARPEVPALFVGARGERIAAGVVRARLARWATRWPSGPYAPGCRCTCTRMCCATPSPRTCCNPQAICARCRRCWGIRAFRRPRCTRIWTSNIWRRPTTPRTRGQRRNSKYRYYGVKYYRKPPAELRAARANRVFCTDERRIRTENTVLVNTRHGLGFYTRSPIRADGFSSAQHRNAATSGDWGCVIG